MLKRWAARFARKRGTDPKPTSHPVATPRFVPLRVVSDTLPHESPVTWEVVFGGETRLQIYAALDVAHLVTVIDALRKPRGSR